MARPTKQLTLDREFAAAVAETGAALPKCPVGDVNGRRKAYGDMFSARLATMKPPPSVTQTQHTFQTPEGHTITLIEFRKGPKPATPGAAVYHIHGGGMILGSVKDFSISTALKCEASGLPIFSIDYRLAPEFPHPIPVNDCYAGLEYLHSHAAELGVDNARIMVQGESAGGGIGAGVVLMARDRKLEPPVAMQMLIYPMLDDRNLTPLPIENLASWKCDDNITGWRALLGDEAAGSEKEVEGHEYAAPARAKDLSGLPATYIDVGQLDLFALEDLKYATRLAEANVPVEFHLYPGLPHGFEALGANTAAVKGANANRLRVLAEFNRATTPT